MITLGILWFTWAGSYWGWESPIANMISVGLGLMGAVWLLRPYALSTMPARWRQWIDNADRLEIALALFLTIAIYTGLFSTDLPASLWRVSTLLAYGVGFYVLKRYYTALQIARGVTWAGWIVFSMAVLEGVYRLSQGLPWGLLLFSHQNTAAMLWACMLPVGLGYLRGNTRILWGLLGGAALLFTGSRGGVMALVVALVVLWWPRTYRRWPFFVGMAFLVALGGGLLAILRWENTVDRIQLMALAVNTIATRPLIGLGPGTARAVIVPVVGKDWFHFHCTPLTILVEMGYLGLISLFFVLGEIWDLPRSPRWAWASVCGFAVFSLVDEPLWFWGSGLGLMAMVAVLITSRGVET